ncbi:hypothetical protein GM921_13110 [Pedobacter sp. LMG 31464]|uniref:Lipoprotein n=1 Tax=Pedobacter planticolens TaxID=2679964 RepID=A0A923DYJ8_9SPHI|nr:hypothetical protein [Pedobacter planticolens]MBB2146434.1 hypothetical protein [Pedobacter planticolens]
MFKYLKVSIWLLCLFLFGCTTNNKPLLIHFSKDSSAIVITNIEPAGLFQLKNNINTDTTYQNLVSVLQTPTDDDSTSMEVEWPGKLSIIGDSLLFTPANPFVKGKSYLIETMLNVQFAKGEEIVKSNVGHAVKAQQQMLKR